MYSRVEKVFIGKSVARTSSAIVIPFVNGATTTPSTAVEGEIFVLDKNKNVLTAGMTAADSDTIYIAEVTGITQTYANEAGTSISSKKVLMSDPIKAADVINYNGRTYVAKAEETAVFTLIGTTAGRETIVRIVYKDMKEHPGQFTQSYRFFESGVAATDATALAKLINNDSRSRVTATPSTAQITLTAKAIPGCTTALTDIDKFSMVNFEVFIYYIDTASVKPYGQRVDYNLTITYGNTADLSGTNSKSCNYGSGNWEQVRDAEKYVIANQFGPTNFTHFPVIVPTFRTVKSTTYNTINIDSNISFLTPDNGYNKKAKVSTKLFLPVSASQTANILAALNPWMESVGQASVTLV